MPLSPFHALYKAHKLSSYAFGQDRLTAVFASSDIEVYPYQIAAACFALRSPYLKGVILCDEGSLGKTYEALLIITQLWYEGKDRLLLIVPTPLLYQWYEIIDKSFSVPCFTLDSNPADEEEQCKGNSPFFQDGIVLTTYDIAAQNAEHIAKVQWDAVIFEEAHHLRRIYADTNKAAGVLKNAVGDAFKLLLTATPMQNSIMDLYGLIHFIDETVFPDEKTFYERYFRKPENYPELTDRVSRFCFRTTRPEVTNYVKIPDRIPVTAEFTLTPREQELYDLLDAYVQRENKAAFPHMDQYDLALMLFRTFSSSTFALDKLLRGVIRRMESSYDAESGQVAAELSELRHMQALAAGIKQNAKAKELLTGLKQGFVRLKELGAQQKALIFTENRTTQNFLFSLLDNGPYKGKVLTYHGGKTREYSIMDRFRNEAKILISTDTGAEGFNLEFCSFVINYDLPYNTLTIEQRINRCHRQGQQSDVLILNFLNRNNFADVRTLELINKRILQFSGIFGMSDNVIGNFNSNIRCGFSEEIATARTRQEIDHIHQSTLKQFESENKQLVRQAKHSLFTSFTRDIAEKVHITPHYIESKAKEIEDDLWYVTRWFFEGKQGFRLDDETRTVSVTRLPPPKVFTGKALRRTEYSMAKGYQPRSGRHTVTGSLAKGILGELFWRGIPESGSIVVDARVEPCELALYEVQVRPKGNFWGGYSFYPLVGETRSGRMLSHDECAALMALPVLNASMHGEPVGSRNRHLRPTMEHKLDRLISGEDFIRKVLSETDSAEKEAVNALKNKAAECKVGLERGLDSLHFQVKTAKSALEKELSRMERMSLQRRCSKLTLELKQAEQNLFAQRCKLDTELEEQIQKLLGNAQLTAKIERLFVVRVSGTA
uniref:DEAD/DEAH box helicase n=1 Tax=uncultured Bilophila sp. TaxID=529385 RepID=UPI0025EBD9F8|nr:DEAD/DEAH box helicase [uncultured Bilophila sp.]